MTVAKMQVQELVEIDVPIAANAVITEDRVHVLSSQFKMMVPSFSVLSPLR